jgi:hypothetical protein
MGVGRRRTHGEQSLDIPARSDSTTVLESVRLLASMQGLDRFESREPTDEVPREVFEHVADELGRAFSDAGWGYARSGPHISRKQGNVRFVFHFGSDTLNVAGRLVAFYVRYAIHDHAMATWRESEGLPIGKDALVARDQIGVLLPHPAATQWNLADARERLAVAHDIEATIRDHGFGFAATAFDVLGGKAPPPAALRSLLGALELLEYLIRFGRIQEARELVHQFLLGLPPRRRQWFVQSTWRLWEEGLSPEPDFSGIVSPRDALTWEKLPFLIVRYDLATESHLSAWTAETGV